MTKKFSLQNFKLNVVADVIDFRDKMYVPTLVEVPQQITVEDFKKRAGKNFPVLHQGETSACTGFAMVTMAHFLLRTRKVFSDKKLLSPHMAYKLARKYDEYAGERDDGSSARGAMKAWHKHGLCSLSLWKEPDKPKALTRECAVDAVTRPLGAYFRVNHKDIVAMHSAISETGILYVSAGVHKNWDTVGKNGIIKFNPEKDVGRDGHAFVIVGYDSDGFWIQNSWGASWGKNGYARISYDDWLVNGDDVWVARLGAPVNLHDASSVGNNFSKTRAAQNAISHNELRPHVISIGNNGTLKETGTFGNTIDDVDVLFNDHYKHITKTWKKKRILLYAHGGLVNEEAALQRLADYRKTLLENEIYPISFIWHTGMWDTLKNILRDGLKSRKSEGWIGDAWDFVIEKTDTLLETVARGAGTRIWSEMKENAMLATTSKNGGARLVAEFISKKIKEEPGTELHIIGHSAGSIFHAPLIHLLSSKKCTATGLNNEDGYNIPIKSLTLWAPAITISAFKEFYSPLISSGSINKFNLYLLDEKTEEDDNCGGIYRKSLLHLVANAFETDKKIGNNPNTGTPLLGMEKWIEKDKVIKALLNKTNCELILSPQNGDKSRCTAREHGAFDDDEKCVADTLSTMLGGKANTASKAAISFNRSSSSIKDKRDSINRITQVSAIYNT